MTYRCNDCRVVMDEDLYPAQTVHNRPVCHDCCEVCEFCGEYLDDEQAAISGAEVRVLRPETDHRYTVGHAYCVGQWILGCMAGIPQFFEVDGFTKDEIAQFYGQAVAA